MSIVPAKCPNCGANLEVEATSDAGICSACGSPFIVEKAINNFNVVNHIQNATINLNFNTEEFVIEDNILIQYIGNKTKVVVPEGVTKISEMCFVDQPISALHCPESVTEVECVFANNANLIEVEMLGVKEIKEHQFENCINLKSVKIPCVEIIGYRAFYFAGAKHNTLKVTMPSLITVKSYSFYKSGLCELIGPELIDIGDSAFNYSSLQTIVLPKIERLCGYDCINEVPIKEIHMPLLKEMRSQFAFCGSLRKVELPSLISMDSCFCNCGFLSEVVVPNATYINNCFNGSPINRLEAPNLQNNKNQESGGCASWIFFGIFALLILFVIIT